MAKFQLQATLNTSLAGTTLEGDQAITVGVLNGVGATGPQGAAGTDGTDGAGFTGGSYNSSTGVVTFTSDDGLGFSTGDLRGADGSGTGTVTSITAGTGLSGGTITTSGTIDHSNSVTADTVSEGGGARTLSYGDTFNVPSVTYDAQGHVTSTTTTTLTLPASDNTDTDTTYSAGTGITLTNTTFSIGQAVATTDDVTFNSVADVNGSVRDIPQNAQTSAYTLIAGDAGKHISITTGGVTVPTGVFGVGDTISIYNNSGSDQTITQAASGVTLRQAGTASTGNRTLAQYGLCTVICVDATTNANVFVIGGAGLS